MLEFWKRLMSVGFMPHGHCYLWIPSMVWTQVASNTVIGIAYLSISATLAYLVQRVRLPFSWVYIAFGAFILACGLTHFFDVVTIWYPVYWADAAVRVITAAASAITAVLIFPLVPKVVSLATVAAIARQRGEELEIATDKLRRSVEEMNRHRLLVENVRDGVFMLDPDGNIQTWNRGACGLMGYESDDIIGQHISIFYAAEDISAKKPKHELDVAMRDGFYEDEGWRLRKDGTRFWANVRVTAMREGSGTLLGFAKMTRDLTERVEAEEKLRIVAAENAKLTERARVQEFQERFLAILGHDLRNPLAAIDMGAALLKQTLKDAATHRVLLRMSSSSLRMSRMIEQILDLTRSRLAGGLQIVPAPVDLTATVMKVVEELRLIHPSRVIIVDGPSLEGRWDADRLEQVLSNLVSNALQHGSENAAVRIDIRDNGATLSISVHNDGPAIPEAIRSQIFDPFRRGERESRTSKTAGLGLGLYISREIVVAHGGEMSVESSSERGTTFQVTLPRSNPVLLS
jgi:PAS domain S-box-containing protein